MRHGRDKMIWAGGRRYSGTLRDDRIEGKGTLIYEDGRKYTGEVESGKPNGKGKMTGAHGNKMEGIWVDGELEASPEKK